MQSIIFFFCSYYKSVRTKKSRKLCVLNSSTKKCMHLQKVWQVRWFAKSVLHIIGERVEKQTFLNTTLSERTIKCEFKGNGTIACLPHPRQVPWKFCFIVALARDCCVALPGGRYYRECGFCWHASFPHKHTKCILKVETPDALNQFFLQCRTVEPLFVLVVVEGGLF